ncbi:hypothetical protein [Streptomyces sp. NPDC005799]|uniref:hypothetical protein n=1 Tax=Streptomyces sp. NPDC005799 TaxID=3154678 RepID=UPI0033FA25DE
MTRTRKSMGALWCGAPRRGRRARPCGGPSAEARMRRPPPATPWISGCAFSYAYSCCPSGSKAARISCTARSRNRVLTPVITATSSTRKAKTSSVIASKNDF